MKSRAILFFLSVFLLTGLVGCGLFGGGDASLSKMTPGMSKRMDKLECWLTIDFKKVPEGIDARDVKVVFSSFALIQDVAFDWNYIAANDVIPQGMGKPFAQNEASVPGQPPAPPVSCQVKYPLLAKPRLETGTFDALILKAELWWGGEKRDSMEQSIEHVYMPEIEPR